MREMKAKAGDKNQLGASCETNTYKFGRPIIQLHSRTQLISNRELRLLDSVLSC